MDLVNSCKDKLGYFRVKELKDILTQLGLSKQGKKQDLIDRILEALADDRASKVWAKKHTLGKEELVKLLDSTYRKMQATGATDLAYKDHVLSDNSSLRAKEEINDHYQSESRVRCLCGSSLSTGSMIKCEDLRCSVWQHVGCAIIPDKPTVGDPPFPANFYCEICRLARADPFLVTFAHPLYPVKLTPSIIPTDGSNPVQSAEKTFHITRADKDIVNKQEYDVQAWCMLLNDKVPFRMQWPQYADLRINGAPVRAINRPGSQLLGANGRDDGVIITEYTKDGINKISLSGTDSRIFCLGVRIVKRRSLQQVLTRIPKECDGESFQEALARVRRCVGGGPSTDNADSDSDIELVAESIVVNLRCPMSGSRMKVAGRFKPCHHMGCFDLNIFVEMNQRSKKWQCPICLKNYSLENIIIDPYFNGITSRMLYCGEDITDIEVKPDGSWRVKESNDSELRDLGNLGLWHFPDGSLCPSPKEEAKSKAEPLKLVKQEGISEGSTSLKLRKNLNGLWEVKKPDAMNNLSFSQRFPQNGDPRGVPMSSSATVSGRDRDDLSVNQDGAGTFDMSAPNRLEYDSSMRVEPGHAAQTNAAIIVLSDSEEDDPLIPSGLPFRNNDASGVNFSGHPSVFLDSFPGETMMGANRNSGLGLFNSGADEYGMPMGYLPPDRNVPGFQSFGLNGPNDVLDLQRTSLNHTSAMNDYVMNPATGTPTFLLPGSNGDRPQTDIDDGFNPLAFGGDDPSLQLFLPTRPSGAAVHTDLRDHQDLANGIHSDDWVSLRLGGGASSSQVAPAGIPLDSRNSFLPREPTDFMADIGPLHLSINGGRSDMTTKPDSHFSIPRQKRSVRPRLYLSIDSNSE